MELAFHGVECLVVEKRQEVSFLRPRAKTTSPRTMEHFRRWGIADEVRVRAGLPVEWSSAAVFCTALLGEELARLDGCFGLDLVGSGLVAEAGQQVAQPIVEEVLRDALASSNLVTLTTGVSGVSVSQSDDRAVVEVLDADGSVRGVETGWVVGCEGARSIVREAIGAHYEVVDAGRPNLGIVFRSAELASMVPHGPAVHYWIVSPAQPGVMGRLDLKDLWWCGANGIDPAVQEVDPQTIVQNLIGGNVDTEVLSTDFWRARVALSSSWARGRLFIAGDAAHQNPPWGGHGFNTGVGDAVNLGWKLAAVINGWAPRELLNTYETERKPIAQQTIDVAVQNTLTLAPELASLVNRLEGKVSSERRTEVAQAIRVAKEAEFHSLGLTLGYSYAGSPIVASGHAEAAPPTLEYRPSAAPGNRLPHFVVDGQSIYDQLGKEFTLLSAGSSALAEQIAATAAAAGVPMTTVEVDPNLCQEHLGARVVLVRPDQHVAWRDEDVPQDPKSVVTFVTGRLVTERAINPRAR